MNIVIQLHLQIGWNFFKCHLTIIYGSFIIIAMRRYTFMNLRRLTISRSIKIRSLKEGVIDLWWNLKLNYVNANNIKTCKQKRSISLIITGPIDIKSKLTNRHMSNSAMLKTSNILMEVLKILRLLIIIRPASTSLPRLHSSQVRERPVSCIRRNLNSNFL